MKNVDNVLSVYDRIMDTISNKWLDFLHENRWGINATFNMFSDDDSRSLYGQELIFCALKNFLQSDMASSYSGLMTQKDLKAHEKRAENLLPELAYHGPNGHLRAKTFKAETFVIGQYRYKNIVGVKKGDICFDCGSGLGETAIWMIQNGADHVHTFEIDEQNIECMKKSFASLGYEKNITIINKALSQSSGEAFYTPSAHSITAGSIITPQNEFSKKVEAIDIDTYCLKNNIIPTYIKMDIEGAEPAAIRGAAKVIKKYKPKLAISIYHKIEHRWTIPGQIKNLVPDYKFYLKKSHPSVDLILFASP